MLSRLAALVLLVPVLAPTTADGAERLYVDAGSVGGQCRDTRSAAQTSRTRPWCSLARAGAAAPAGATVFVRRGRYPELKLVGRTPARAVRFTGYRRERPVVAGLTLERSSRFAFSRLRLTAGVVLSDVVGVRFADLEVGLVARGAQTGSGFLVTGARDVHWSRVHVHDAWNGIQFRWGGASGVSVRDSRFSRLGNAGVHVQFATGMRIEHNEFVDVRARADMSPGAHADGVHVVGPARDVRIVANRFRGGRGVLLQPDPQAPASVVDGAVLENNVFAGPDFAIRAVSSPRLRIVHNTAWGPGRGPGTGIDLRAGGGAPRTEGVTLQNNVASRLDADPGVTFAARDHNLIADGLGALPDLPRFLRGGLRLAPGSPGVRSGLAAAGPARDRDGRRRSTPPDLGAY